MKTTKKNGVLLIVGNGFDLYCQLKSSFIDFLKTVRTDSNIWYLLAEFRYLPRPYYAESRIISEVEMNDIKWMDIESLIKDVLYISNKDKNILSKNTGFTDYSTFLNETFSKRNNGLYLNNVEQASRIRLYLRQKYPYFQESFDPVSFLKNELSSFETDLQNYLREISKTDMYKENSSHLLNTLLKPYHKNTVLSFNYTQPNDTACKRLVSNNYQFIHGNLKNNIIIGFDSSDVKNEQDTKLELSKLFQKLMLNGEQIKLPDRDDIKVIKFFGHSLGKQDYTYFHSLFDYYDIYKNDVNLEFCFVPFKTSEYENHLLREKYIMQIQALLSEYAHKSRVNSDLENSVLSRLILENRIKITAINPLPSAEENNSINK